MPMPEIRRMKMATDQKRRLLPLKTGNGCAEGRPIEARGGATEGPVGDLRKGLASSPRLSTDNSILLPMRATHAPAYQSRRLYRGGTRRRRRAASRTNQCAAAVRLVETGLAAGFVTL